MALTPQDKKNHWQDLALAVLFLVAVAAAVYFRSVGLNWDENQHLHPDERFLTMVETGIAPVKSLSEFFDSAKSSLNPVNRGYGFFVYGTLPIFIVRYVGEALQQTDYNQITLVGRQLSALADLGALLFLFVMARRLYGDRVAVLAALLSAAAVLPIQQSHFFTVDTFANFFVVAAFYFILRASREGGWFHFAASGLAVGMAVASKANVWPVAGFVALAAVLYWSRDERTRNQLGTTLFKLMLAGLLAALAFRVFQPYAFSGPKFWNISLEPRWSANMNQVQSMVNGTMDYPPGHQWTDRAPIIFPWVNMVVWGLGIPLGLAAWAGWVWMAWEILTRKRWRDHLLPWLWATAFFIYQGTQWVKSMRYILPVYPFFILFAAYLLVNFKFRISNFKFQKKTALALATVVVIGTAAWAWGFTRIYARPVTRVAASQWMYENVPTAATLHYATESGEGTLQMPLPADMPFSAQPTIWPFHLPVTATLTSVTLHHLADSNSSPSPETIRAAVTDDMFNAHVLAQAELTTNLEQAGVRGGSYTFNFARAPLNSSQDYYLNISVSGGGQVIAHTSVIGNEHWDDPLPLRMEGKDAFSIYRGIDIPNYAEDDTSKYAQMISWLTQADYLVLSSNRLYGSIPRLPTRYPMTSEYYRAMFDGRLGFEKVAEFDSYVKIGPFCFPDQESTEALGVPNPFDRAPGCINVPLPPAEEAFSVYDHPRVALYRKTADFSPERAAQILGRFDLDRTVKLWPTQATAAPTALLLDPDVWQKQQQFGTWSELYNRNSLLNRFPLLAIAAWWLLLFLLGVIAWPLIAFAWPALADRGWGLARTLGLLIVTYLAWLAASLRVLTFARSTLLVATLILAAVGVVLALKRRAEIGSFLRQSWRLILVEEILFAVVFAIFLLIRYGNGDLWHFVLGGERPMDFAYLNAVLKSNYFPPYDPWFAGGEMNYYYFGFVLVSTPIKLLGIVPALAYNIVLPMLAALTATGAFSVAFNLFRMSEVGNRKTDTQHAREARSTRHAIGVGLLAALFVVFLGNLGELYLIYTQLSQLGASAFRSTIPGLQGLVSAVRGLILIIQGQRLTMNVEWWYWNASRIMTNGEINEFPFFTFLYSDLHAHMIAFPLTVLMLGLAVGWAMRRQWHSVDAAVSVVIGALVVGVARANNTWDYPTYLALALIALFISGLRSRSKDSGLHAVLSGALGVGLFGAAWVLGGINDVPTFVGIAVLLFVAGQLAHRLIEDQSGPAQWRWIDAAYIGVMGLSILAFRPYIEHYATAYSSVELWKGARTPLQPYILIHGIFLFPVAVYALAELRRMGLRWLVAATRSSGAWFEMALVIILTAGVATAALTFIGYEVILVVAPLMALTLLVLLRWRREPVHQFVLVMTLMALALTFAVEVIVLKGDIGRMNTVFKFYLQVWIMLGIASAVMIGWLAQNMRRWSRDWREAVTLAIVALVAAGLLYPILATRAKINDRFDVRVGPTLDSMKFMTLARANEQGQEYSFRDEYDALIWMQDNIKGTPVVAESAVAPEYRSLRNRVTTYTGLPALIGYNWHQKQQRSILPSAVVDDRTADANQIFASLGTSTAWTLIQHYNVGYVIVGYPERLYYPAAGLAKFDQMVAEGRLRVAYKNEHVTLYEVVK
jgi:YYY domain-containing protein